MQVYYFDKYGDLETRLELLLLTLPGGGDGPGDGEELVEHPEGADPLYCGQTTSLNNIGPWIVFLHITSAEGRVSRKC